MGEWMDGWVDGWMGGWMDGWMDGHVAIFSTRSFSKARALTSLSLKSHLIPIFQGGKQMPL